MWGKKGRKRHHTQNYPASRRTARSKCWKQLLCGACKDATACTQHHSFFPINTSHFTALLFYSPLQTTASLGFHLLFQPIPHFWALGSLFFPCLGSGQGWRGGSRRTQGWGCCRAGSHWKPNKLPVWGAQSVLRAGCQLQTSSREWQGKETLLACKLCSQAFGDLLLSPGV